MRRLAAAGFLLVLAASWSSLAPPQLGGSNSYVTTHGDSMEPGFRTGDLAVVRPADDYEVGDVVAYHSDILDTVVMHRVVAVQDGQYTFKGDNNSWLDADRPTRDRFVGSLVLRIPQGGLWRDRLTSPTALGLMTFGLLAGGRSALQRRRRRRSVTVSRHLTRDQHSLSLGSLPPWGVSAGVAVALAALLGVLLAIPAWTTPPGRSGGADSPAPRTMTFSYSTEVRPSAAYDDTTVTSPDPVFRTLAKTVDVRYAYRGRPGTIAVAAELSTAGGWHSTVPLRPRVSFSGDRYTGTVRLNLQALENRAQSAAAVTGIPAAEVQVAVVPKVTSADGTTFEPALTLTLTPLQLAPAGDGSTLAVRESASETTTAPGAETLSIAGRDLSVRWARILSVVLLLGALLGALVLGLLALVGTRGGEAATIRRRYAPILIQVQPMPTPPGRPVVDVVDFATLAKLAQRYGLLVMHWSRSNVETFVVQDEGTTYRYRTGTGSATNPAEVTADTPR